MGRRSVVFIVNFEDFTHCSDIAIVDFEQVNAGWECTLLVLFSFYFQEKSLFQIHFLMCSISSKPIRLQNCLTIISQERIERLFCQFRHLYRVMKEGKNRYFSVWVLHDVSRHLDTSYKTQTEKS